MGRNVYLYHGSDKHIGKPRWDVGKAGRDFGICFYTTYDSSTAKDWANKNFGGNGVINKYSIDLEKFIDGNLRIKRFYANEEWAEFVWNNRFNSKYRRPNFDIIIGPIADKGLKEHFMKIRTEGKTFAEIAPLIHYDRFKSLQVCFCSDYAISILNLRN